MSLARRRLFSDLVLLLASLLWGLAFVPQRFATEHLGPLLFNGLRFLLGALLLCPALPRRPRPSRKMVPWIIAAGCVLTAGANLQQAGIKYTTAGSAGFLTGLYVVLVPVVLLIGFRQRMPLRCWLAAAMAAAGTFLLSADSGLHIGYGDGLVLIGSAFWAVHIVLVGRAVTCGDVLWFSVGQFFVAGVLSTGIGLGLELHTLAGLGACWWAVGYAGAISIAAGYTLQAVGQRHAPAADAAVILSMEAVFAALFGMLLLSETMTGWQYVGCAVILSAVIFSQIGPVSSKSPAPAGAGTSNPEP